MSGIEFVSKSGDAAFIEQRNLRREAKGRNHVVMVESEIKYLKLPPTIFCIGSLPEDFVDYGLALGFTLRKYEDVDISILLHAKALVLIDPDMDFGKYIETTNFASCYGVPIIWFSKKSIPHRHMWRFKACLVGDISKEVFWRELWQIL